MTAELADPSTPRFLVLKPRIANLSQNHEPFMFVIWFFFFTACRFPAGAMGSDLGMSMTTPSLTLIFFPSFSGQHLNTPPNVLYTTAYSHYILDKVSRIDR